MHSERRKNKKISMSRHLEKIASISPDQNRAQINKDLTKTRRNRHFELASLFGPASKRADLFATFLLSFPGDPLYFYHFTDRAQTIEALQVVPPVWYHLYGTTCIATLGPRALLSRPHFTQDLDNLGGLRFKEAKRASPCISLHLLASPSIWEAKRASPTSAASPPLATKGLPRGAASKAGGPAPRRECPLHPGRRFVTRCRSRGRFAACS